VSTEGRGGGEEPIAGRGRQGEEQVTVSMDKEDEGRSGPQSFEGGHTMPLLRDGSCNRDTLPRTPSICVYREGSQNHLKRSYEIKREQCSLH
jgi:hypothetical protein